MPIIPKWEALLPRMGSCELTDARGKRHGLAGRPALRAWARQNPDRAVAFGELLEREVWVGGRLVPLDELPVAIARAHIGAGVCPACGYDLAGCPAEPDGCIVCPECGGAWSR
ncbi:MAG: hypothetical protein ACF8R7_12600 [Phycisphaerales bacterium JB039]